jgi:hypothetical protein
VYLEFRSHFPFGSLVFLASYFLFGYFVAHPNPVHGGL